MYLIIVLFIILLGYHQRNNLKLYITRSIGYLLIYKNKFKYAKSMFKLLNVSYEDKHYTDNIEYYLYNDKPTSSIEIEYVQNTKNYIIVFDNYDQYSKHTLPIYDDLHLKGNTHFSKNSESIILISTNNNGKKEYIIDDDANIIKKLSGPKGNFYNDKLICSKHSIINSFNKLSSIRSIDNLELYYSDGEIIYI